jgi:hypothetical protein
MARLARILPITFAVLYALSPVCAERAYAASPSGPEFSAVIEAETAGSVTKSRIYLAKDRQRLEVTDPGTGVDAVMIIRLDRKVAWTLIPSMKAYMEAPVKRQEVNPIMRENDVVGRERIGPDTVDGHPAVKEKVTVKNEDGTKSELYYWEASDIGFPIRVAAVDGSWTYTYREVRQGKQAPSLFEVPEGYRRMAGTPEPDDGGDDTEQPDAPDSPDGTDSGDPGMPTPYF